MQTFLYVQINAFALIILVLIFLNIHNRSESYLIEQKLFLTLLLSNALVLVFDSITWILDGKLGFLVREIYRLVNAIYYALTPTICMLWALYIDYIIYRDEARLKKILIPMIIPACINAFLSFLSIRGNYMFFMDTKNIYHRGEMFLIGILICYFYLLYALILIIKNRNKVQKQNFIPIFISAFPPFIGGFLQVMFFGLSLTWICMTLSILIVFINIQNNQLYTDHLTGLFNRRQLDYYLNQRVRKSTDKFSHAGIMMDLNSFKNINDLYGHYIGDEALKHTSLLLKKSFRKTDFIARYGGDEFIVIMKIDDPHLLTQLVDQLRTTMDQFNDKKIVPYTLSLSIGYDFYKPDSSPEEFIKHIDTLMYNDKSLV